MLTSNKSSSSSPASSSSSHVNTITTPIPTPTTCCDDNDQLIVFGVGDNNYSILNEQLKHQAHLIIDRNDYHQLLLSNINTTNNTTNNKSSTKQLTTTNYNNYKIDQVSCGGDFLFILLKDQTNTINRRLLAAGYNGTGEQGVPITTTPPPTSTTSSYSSTSSSTKLRDITNEVLQQINRNSTIILQAQCGWNHSMILVEHDSSSEDGTAAITEYGKGREFALYGTGFNNHGQLSLGNTHSTSNFVRAVMGDSVNGSEQQGSALQQIERLISRFNTCAFITRDRNLYASGNNGKGELGRSGTIYKFEHVFSNVLDADFSYSHSVIIDVMGQIYSSGSNDYGKLGRENRNTEIFTKIVNFPEKAIKVSLGIHHTMILTENNHVYGCGYNENGELGQNSTKHSDTFKMIQSPYLFKDVSVGFYNSAFLTIDNQVMVCGAKWKTFDKQQNGSGGGDLVVSQEKAKIPQFLYCGGSGGSVQSSEERRLYSKVNSICGGGYFLLAYYKEVGQTRQLREMFIKLKHFANNSSGDAGSGSALSDVIIHH